MLVRRCFTNDYDQDHDSKISQRNLEYLKVEYEGNEKI